MIHACTARAFHMNMLELHGTIQLVNLVWIEAIWPLEYIASFRIYTFHGQQK